MATVAIVDEEGKESLWMTSIGKYSILVLYVLTNNWYGIDIFRIIGNMGDDKWCVAF